MRTGKRRFAIAIILSFVIVSALLIIAVLYFLFDTKNSVHLSPEAIGLESTEVAVNSSDKTADSSDSDDIFAGPSVPVKEHSVYSVIGSVYEIKSPPSGKASAYLKQFDIEMNTGLRDGSMEQVIIDLGECALKSFKVYALELTYDFSSDKYECTSAAVVSSYGIFGDVVSTSMSGDGKRISRIKVDTTSGRSIEDVTGHVLVDTTTCDVRSGKAYSFGIIRDPGSESYICYAASIPNDGF